MSLFRPAQKSTVTARVGIAGPSGSGKTYTGLAIATGLAEGRPIAVVDTENGEAELYADEFRFETAPMSQPYLVSKYVRAITEAAKLGFGAVLIDSLTPAWKGTGGILQQVDTEKLRLRGNDFAAWQLGDKLHQELVDAVVGCPIHLVATLRSKQAYVLETNSNGKQVPKKVGLEPIFRDGIDYEFSVFMELDHDHNAVVTKSRITDLADAIIAQPDHTVGQRIVDWLTVPTAPEGAPTQA